MIHKRKYITKHSMYLRARGILYRLMYINFLCIIVVQTLVYLFCAWHKKRFLTLRELYVSGIFGIAIGAFFDVVAGLLHLYTYVRTDNLILPNLWNLTVPELLINGALSFGLTVATANVILEKQTPLTVTTRSKLFALFLTLLNISLFSLIFAQQGTLLLMILIGIIIVSTGELILLIQKKYGPLGELLTPGLTIRTWRLFIYSISMGMACEIANLFFPFWKWLPESNLPSFGIILIIICFGYAGLLHPMIVFWRLLEKR